MLEALQALALADVWEAEGSGEIQEPETGIQLDYKKCHFPIPN